VPIQQSPHPGRSLSNESVRTPVTLLVHDGELNEVRDLLGALGTPFVERRGRLTPEDRTVRWDLVIATPKRLLDLHLRIPGAKPPQIAVCDQDSRTLRNSLQRAGIKLILHSLYRGPEKRRTTRVSVGAPVRFRLGWRQRQAILADLSVGGCRLLTEHPAERGKSLTLVIPAEFGAGKAFSVKGRVLRCARAEGEPAGTHALMARFDKLSDAALAKLRSAVKHYATGPARLGRDEASSSGEHTDCEEAGERPAEAAAEAAVASAPPKPANAWPSAEAARDRERRGGPRCSVDRHVIALGDQATRVLMGRDISAGGMRVNPNPHLAVGEDVRLAIHLGDRDVPLVVRARVHRDDGERGMMLRFHELAEEETRFLNSMLEVLPVVEPGDADAADTGFIVSEILEEALSP
jgi:hypothetical protein